MLASGEISKGSLVRSWPGNRAEVVKRGRRTAIRRSARNVASLLWLGRVVGHPWSGADTFGEVH